jgi:hypothetical protein
MGQKGERGELGSLMLAKMIPCERTPPKYQGRDQGCSGQKRRVTGERWGSKTKRERQEGQEL